MVESRKRSLWEVGATNDTSVRVGFSVRHVPVKEHVVADYLSRLDMGPKLPLTAYGVNNLEGGTLEPVRQRKADPNL